MTTEFQNEERYLKIGVVVEGDRKADRRTDTYVYDNKLSEAETDALLMHIADIQPDETKAQFKFENDKWYVLRKVIPGVRAGELQLQN
jgi:hypothetical protein